MKDLKALSPQELTQFFTSFDLVLCDVHGVLLNILGPLPGTPKAVKSIQNMGKKFAIVSNNTTESVQDYLQGLNTLGFELEEDEVVTPIQTLISYLQHVHFNKKIFILGTQALQDSVKKAGFQVAERGPMEIEETLRALADSSTKDDEEVGAVISDIDINFNYVNLQKALTFLLKPEVIFLKGPEDLKFPMGEGKVIIGPGMFSQLLEEMSGRKAIPIAKPSVWMKEFVLEKYQIKDVSRVLFIGDTIQTDMGFAGMVGFQKLLVLSGLTKMEDLEDWRYPEELKPEFYVDGLSSLRELIAKVV